jgi:hypothetical protein
MGTFLEFLSIKGIGAGDLHSLDLRTMNVAGVDRNGWRFPETRHWPVVNGRLGGAARLQMELYLDRARRSVTNHTA